MTPDPGEYYIDSLTLIMKRLLHFILTTLVVTILIALGGVQESTAQWKKVTNLPSPYNSGYYLDVFFLPTNPLYGWVCGFRGFVLRTTDGGQTWQGVTIPSNGGSSLSPMLESIHFATPLVGYTSGPDGIFKTTNGGSIWRNVTPPNPRNRQFWGCYFVTPDIGMLVAGGCNSDGQGFFRTTDGGATWTEYSGFAGASGMSDVMLYSRDGIGYASSSGWIWKTLDGGVTWNQFSQTGALYWQEEITNLGSSFFVPTSGNDCSGTGTNDGSLRFSTDNGTTWRRYNTGEPMFGSFLINSQTGWGVGSNRSVYYTDDGGMTWENRNCGIEGDDDLDDVYFINDSIGWTVGDGLYHTNYPKALTVSIKATGQLKFCDRDSVILEASEGFASYKWSDGSSGRKIVVKKGGVYTVSAFDKEVCVYAVDSITVTVLPLPKSTVSLSSSRPVICFGDTLTLSAPIGYPSYLWSTGETTQEIRTTVAGAYVVAIIDTNGCVSYSDTIRVRAIPKIKPVITAKRNFTFCQGDSLTMFASPGYSSYRWSNGATTSSFTTKIGGPFTVTVVDSNGCVGVSDTVIAVELFARNKLQIVVASGFFDFDSTALGERNCRTISLRNRDSVLPYVLDNPYLIRNMVFSVPQSQLPIIIPPLDTSVITVCFAPYDTMLQRDTLIFEDTCSVQTLPLVAQGSVIFTTGISRCEIPLAGVIYSLGANYRVSLPYPQPSNETATLKVTAGDSFSGAAHNANPAVLKDMLGNTVAVAESRLESTSGIQHIRHSVYQYTFDTRHLVAGVYYIVLQLGTDVSVTPLLVQH